MLIDSLVRCRRSSTYVLDSAREYVIYVMCLVLFSYPQIMMNTEKLLAILAEVFVCGEVQACTLGSALATVSYLSQPMSSLSS